MTKLHGFLDFDNTQMFTETLAIPSLIKRFNELYGDQIDSLLTEKIFHDNFHGQGKEVLSDNLADYYNIDVDYPTLFEDRDWHIMEMCRNEGVEMADGLIEALHAIADDVVLSLTSNNNVQRCIAGMRYAINGRGDELVRLFQTRMFEAGDKQKPNPAIYKRALIQTGADAAQSFCVEDSFTGVIAGKKAGLTVFGFTGFADDKDALKQRQLEEGAVASFHHWSEFPALLKQHFDL